MRTFRLIGEKLHDSCLTSSNQNNAKTNYENNAEESEDVSVNEALSLLEVAAASINKPTAALATTILKTSVMRGKEEAALLAERRQKYREVRAIKAPMTDSSIYVYLYYLVGKNPF
jgi:hypothetical protein